MRVRSWLWNFSTDYPGSTNDDTQLPIAEMCIKTHESSAWFSAAQLAGFSTIYRDQGIEMTAWCVPTGLVDDAALAIKVLNDLRAAGIPEPWLQFNVEVENTPYFWKGTPEQLANVFRTTKAACPWAHLELCCYQYGAEFDFAQVAAMPEVERITSEDYWNDFGTSPEARLTFSYGKMAPHGKPMSFGLPGNAPAGEMTRALRWLDDRGLLATPPIIWRRGSTTQATWNAIAAFTPTPPAPPPPPSPTYDDAALLIDLDIIARGLDDLSARSAVQAQGVRDVSDLVGQR